MTMFSRLIIAGATLAALAAPALAATGSQMEPRHAAAWTVLQDAGRNACYVADRKAGPGEAQVSGFFRSEIQAQAAIGSIASCQRGATLPSDTMQSFYNT
ncbi:MAG: hypothetical protein KDJ86_06020 [Bauldia sp.]|uniref:hypothetical protein n=1 Tax=Bauldia sp. TaxID=2575872 RepID=UPI001DAD4DA8|nr:hypothetical protein [Bauldia sp.]MCB1495320.1 hypothetical protein [Bauldia sp.]